MARKALWERRTFGLQTIRTFIGQPNRWLVFVGALIVFMTFVLKEGYREDLKDGTQALAAARLNFVDSQRHQQLINEMEKLRVAIARGSSDGVAAGQAQKSNQSGNDTIEDSQTVNAVARTLSLLHELVDKVKLGDEPTNYVAETNLGEPTHKNTVSEQLKVLDNAQENLEGLLTMRQSARIAEVCEIYSPNICDWKASDFDKNHGALLLAGANQIQRVYGLAGHALGMADKRVDAMERKTVRVTWAARICFVLGWSLGLAGKIYGGDDGPEAE
jgi:hypothetical protein